MTRVLRRHRNSFSDGAALLIGDVLLYQTHGERRFVNLSAIRSLMRRDRVTLLAHSLGGIACFDLLALLFSTRKSTISLRLGRSLPSLTRSAP